jgi:signal peptidase II
MKRARFPIILITALAVIAADRFSKAWFLKHFQWGESRPVTPFLHWTLVSNTGSAFGMFQNNNQALLVLAYVILGILLYSARGLCERGGGWAVAGVALILGGAIGNIVDRHLFGFVVDFIDLRVWPVFNVADSAITVGAALTALGMMFDRSLEKHQAAPGGA